MSWLGVVQQLNQTNSQLFVKPARGSNSDGVMLVRGAEGVIEAAMTLAAEVPTLLLSSFLALPLSLRHLPGMTIRGTQVGLLGS